MSDKVLCRIEDTTATVIINRPEKRNALDSETWRSIGSTMIALNRRSDLRCVVITGAGNDAFSSGNDIGEFESARGTAAQVQTYNEITAATVAAIDASLHPTVARIAGFCLGGGLEIALACDIRLASSDARLGLPVKTMGIYLDPALAQTLVHTIGRAAALEMVLEGRIYSADEACARGIVTRVTGTDGLDAETTETVARISSGAPLAARYNREAIRRVAGTETTPAEAFVAAASYGDSHDYRAAYRAFSTRSKPVFEGH